MNTIPSKMFTPVGKDLAASGLIKRPPVSYFQDAIRRLKKHTFAIVSFWVLIVLITLSLIGPVISKLAFGHTFKKQDLSMQNQISIMSDKRSIRLTKNDIIGYKKYRKMDRKTKIKFSTISLKNTGKFSLRIGDSREEVYQGDAKEYILEVTLTEKNWDTFLSLLREENSKLKNSDPDFLGVRFSKKGNTFIISSEGKSWFNTKYWFGTDEFGRDLFTRCWEGGRLSFLIAFISVFLTVIVGVIYGGISGYFGGVIDMLLMRIIEILMVVPALLYIILLLTVMKPGILPIILVLGATGWMTTARIVRGEILRLKYSEYVMASELLGAGSTWVIIKHLIPNTMGPIIVNATMMIPNMIFVEAFLSFIGLGVPVPYASWGSLINDGAKIFTQQPNQLFVPSIALSLAMLAFNLFGDGLRDALDPKLRK